MGGPAVHAIGFGLVSSAIVAIGAIGFTLQFGVTNVINIAYGSSITMAAFASLIVRHLGLGLVTAVIVAPIAGAVVTLILARTVLATYARRHGSPFDLIMVTLALSLILQYAIAAITQSQQYVFSFPTGSQVKLGPFTFTVQSLALIGVAAAIFVAIVGVLHLTRIGKAMRAVSVDPSLARACGIPTRRIVNLTWIVTGALAGVAGLVFVMNSYTLDQNTGSNFLILVLAAALLGGAGSPSGAVLASLVVGIATEEVAAFGGSYYSQAAALGILALVLLLRQSSRTWGAALQGEVTV